MRRRGCGMGQGDVFVITTDGVLEVENRGWERSFRSSRLAEVMRSECRQRKAGADSGGDGEGGAKIWKAEG